MTQKRRPGAFRIDQPREPADEPVAPPMAPEPRKPRALGGETIHTVEPDPYDYFEEADETLSDPPPATAPRRRSRLGAIAAAAIGILVSLAVGLWTESLIRDLFARADWLGWIAFAVALVGALAIVALIARETIALARLRSVEALRRRAAKAVADNDATLARAVIAELGDALADQPGTAAGRRALRDLDGEIIDGADLMRLAEAELLVQLDAEARKLVLDAAKRVSVVTAVSPRALVDLAYVAFEAARLIRRLAELYGGRPGTLGFLRLARQVLAHLAVTGVIAAGDDFVHQIVGQGLAARLSAKLGEGVVNGMMTARIGLAAMEMARPLPFAPERRPRMSDFLSALTSYTARKATTSSKARK